MWTWDEYRAFEKKFPKGQKVKIIREGSTLGYIGKVNQVWVPGGELRASVEFQAKGRPYNANYKQDELEVLE
jgi:hypothetical protein